MECDLGPMPLAFLDAGTAGLEAEELARLCAEQGLLGRPPVEDGPAATGASTAIGPGFPDRLR